MSREELFRVAIFIDQLKHEESALRLSATKSITQIAAVIGPQRTVEELLPFLCEAIDDDEVVLQELIKQVGELKHYIGGEENIKELFRFIGPVMLAADTQLTRDMVVDLCRDISFSTKAETAATELIPIVFGLLKSEYWNEVSAGAMLAPVLVQALAGNQKEKDGEASSSEPIASRTLSDIEQKKIDEVLNQLILCSKHTSNDTRKRSIDSLAKIIPMLTLGQVRGGLTKLAQELIHDIQDSVLMSVTDLFIELGKYLVREKAINTPEYLRVVSSLLVSLPQSSQPWRVRAALARRFEEVISLGAKLIETDWRMVVNFMTTLLVDPEPEVRHEILKHLASGLAVIQQYRNARISNLLGTSFMTVLSKLYQDESDFVRHRCAKALPDIARYLPKEETSGGLVQLGLRLLADPDAKTRVASVRRITELGKESNMVEFIDPTVETIGSLLRDPSWRIRHGALAAIPPFAEVLGVEKFNAKLGGLIRDLLRDEIMAVREQAIRIIVELAQMFGETWVMNTLWPYVQTLRASTNYFHRVTALTIVSHLFRKISPKVAESAFLPAVVKLASDSVPNTRIEVLHLIQKLRAQVSKDVFDATLAPIISVLTRDTDDDVRTLALTCL